MALSHTQTILLFVCVSPKVVSLEPAKLKILSLPSRVQTSGRRNIYIFIFINLLFNNLPLTTGVITGGGKT